MKSKPAVILMMMMITVFSAGYETIVSHDGDVNVALTNDQTTSKAMIVEPPEVPTGDMAVTGCFVLKCDPSEEFEYEPLFRSMSAKVNKELIRQGVYYLSGDPRPRRVLNYSLPGHALSTLEEADP